MSWFRRRRIDLNEQAVNDRRSREALKESEEKLKEARDGKAEIVRVANKSKELVKRNEPKLNGEPA